MDDKIQECLRCCVELKAQVSGLEDGQAVIFLLLIVLAIVNC